jgi:hypothetical protein
MTKRTGASVGLCAGLLALAMTAAAQDRGLVRVPAPVGPDGQIRELYAGSYALLIGVAQYQDRVAWSSLISVPDELLSLEEALRAQGFDAVHKVMNPTGAELRQVIDDFLGRYGFNPGNRLLFFFAGHGYTLDGGERGFFVPRDAPDPLRDEQGFRRVALSMQQIATWAQEITARHALFAFDSCFSGSIFRTRERSVPQRINAATAQPVREFLSAGGAGEPVPARSVFTPIVVRALGGAADLDGDGFITGTELGNFVQREVIEYKTGQTPQFGKIRDVRFDQGDIVFVPARGVVSGSTLPAVPRPAENLGSVARSGSATPIAPEPPPAAIDQLPPPIAPLGDRAAIEETLNEYRRAYEARNLARLQRVFPTLSNPSAVKTAFDEAREVLVGMSPPDIRITSDTEASARTRLNQNFVPRVGVARSAPTRDVTFTLRKDAGRWVIVSLR